MSLDQMESLLTQVQSAVFAMPSGHLDDYRNTPRLFPVVSLECLSKAESVLGFNFPPIMREIYARIGNGGVNLGGIMGVVISGHSPDVVPCEDDDLIHAYCNIFGADDDWPACLLPLEDLGCNAWLFVKCDEPEYPVWAYVADYYGPQESPPEGLSVDEQDAFMTPLWEQYESTISCSDMTQPFWVPISPSLESWWMNWLENPTLSSDPRLRDIAT